MNYHKHKDCIDACLDCSALCYHCASEDAEEKNMEQCMLLNMECAIICSTAAHLMSMGSERAVSICKICAEICRLCAAECGKHNYQHCHECAEACRKCAELCGKM